MTPFVLSLLVTLALSPLVRVALLRGGVLDVPNERSSHAVPVPRGGGIAVLCGILAGLVVADVWRGEVRWVAVAGVVALAVVGFVDDRRGLGVLVRLIAQVAAGAVMGGVVGGPVLALLGAMVTPVAVNAVNFMDGINGITSLQLAVWGGAALVAGTAGGSTFVAVIGAVTAGSALGFLPWNAPRARLFLGDVGSYLLGGVVSLGVIAGVNGRVNVWVVVAPMFLYLADTGTALVRRLMRGASLGTAHREHVYQRLVDSAKMPHIVVALVMAVLSALVAAAWAFGPALAAIAVSGLAVFAYLSMPYLAARLWPLPRERARMERNG